MSTTPALAALLALPWVRTADRMPEWAKDSTARFIVLTAPVVGATGRLSADLNFAAYEGGGRWLWVGYANYDRRVLIQRRVVAWLDVTHWDRDGLVNQLDRSGDATERTFAGGSGEARG